MRPIAALPVLLACSVPAIAGFCSPDPLPDDFRHEFQFFSGYSPESATLIGSTTGARFIVAGFEYSYRCWAWKPVSVSFTAGMLPGAIQRVPLASVFYVYDPGSIPITNPFGGVPGIGIYSSPAHWVYGFGVTPVGFTFDFGRKHPVYPYTEINTGIITSTEPIPLNIPNATALNFLIDIGGGVKWRPAGKRYGFEAGYKFLHISNAFTTPVDPGVDNNVFYAGFSIYR